MVQGMNPIVFGVKDKSNYTFNTDDIFGKSKNRSKTQIH